MSQLTKKDVEDLPPGRHFDPAIPGFGVDVTPAGIRRFFVRFWAGGRRQFLRIGVLGEVTIEEARKQAKKARGAAALGKDPRAELGLRKAGGVPTFREWKKTYLEELAGRRKRLYQIEYHLSRCPKSWDSRQLDAILEADVAAFFAKQRKTPILANRWRAHLSGCLGAARRRGLIPANPVEGVGRYPENAPRARTLSPEELLRLRDAIIAERDPFVRAAIRLQMETGCRIGETLAAKWEDLDLEAGVWRLPATKAGRPQSIYLAPGTVAWLKELPHGKGPYIIAGPDPDKPRSSFLYAWRRIRTKARLDDDVRTHDVRRTVGLLVARQAGIHMASKILRHSSVTITAHTYAPLDEREIRGAVAGFLTAMGGETK